MGFSSQSSNQQPGVLYDYTKVLPPWQQKLQASTAPMLAQAAQGGFTPVQQNQMLTQANQNIAQQTAGSTQGLKEQFAASGINGGMLGQALGGLQESAIQASGNAANQIQNASTQQQQTNMQNFLKLLQAPPAFATTGGGGSSSGSQISLAI